MKKGIAVIVIIVGIINFLPVIGVLGPERLSSLYGLAFDEPNLAILMRHRAILFGLLGVFLIYAGIKPKLQPFAFVVGLIAMISFIALAWSTGNYNDAICRIVLIDLVAVIGLLIAMLLYLLSKRTVSHFSQPKENNHDK